MNLEQIQAQYEVVGIIDLDQWTDNYEKSRNWLHTQCQLLYRSAYTENQRIVFLHTHDYYVKNSESVGIVLKNIQVALNEVDISNYFAVICSTNPDISQEIDYVKTQSSDPVAIKFELCPGEYRRIDIDAHPYSRREQYQYGSANPLKINLNSISEHDKFLLSESKNFCIYPWMHMHAWPTGEAYPCCHATHQPIYGNTHRQPLAEIWNETRMRGLRQDMLNDVANETCRKCHEQENSGFFSGRQSANKHHGHHIERVHRTEPDGTFNEFEMTYWDIRFSNLCNLSCRSCGHIFSSSWYQDQAKIAGGDWKKYNKALNYAGRTETDMWEQLLPHLDYVEQIYFAGGEPLLMEEHYHILDELVKRGRFNVRLVYNTNFTHTDLKGNSVFEYWKQFDSVAVGASLDAMGPRGEYIRKGTDWAVVEQNRRDMMRICPEVDFYISPTLSIMNALHLPDFHRDWVEKGLLRPQDLNVNILQDPYEYRIDIAPQSYKELVRDRYLEHLDWLRPRDSLHRATVGFESAITYMMDTDNTALIPKFWSKTQQLDEIRKENILDIIPELAALK
jgi:radical SAM protein with 4Fe4S-binding SPASM domain